MTRQEQCIQGAALAPLDSAQRQRLARLARKAYEASGKRQEASGTSSPLPLPACPSFDAWRHQQCLFAVERPGLTHCRQEDYQPVRAHFLRLLGYGPAADRAELRAATEPRRQAEAVLRRELHKAQDVIQNPAAYLAAIARCKFKTADLSDLSENQLWTLIYDIRRAAQKKRARQEDVPF